MAERNLDFDTVIDRKNTGSVKYDTASREGMPEDALSLWVADMDFKTSSYVQDALRKFAEHGIFGYNNAAEDYFEAVRSWHVRHHDWRVEKEWLVKTPGIVFALSMAVQAFTGEGDGVLIQQPVYHPFARAVLQNGRRLVDNPLLQDENGKYYMDIQDFEDKIVREQIKLFILCSPHNPVGRVWSGQELERIGDICYRHKVIIISDEIHSDFVFRGKHCVLAGLKKEYEEITVTCTAPSKTFNIAGLQVSNIFIPNERLRTLFEKRISACGCSQPNSAGLTACLAAYRDGEEWYRGMLSYIGENIRFAKAFLAERLPEVKMWEPEGTYLIWLDLRSLGLSHDKMEELIVRRARLWLDDGAMFGAAGEGFQRVNTACPRSVLKQALERLERAIREIVG